MIHGSSHNISPEDRKILLYDISSLQDYKSAKKDKIQSFNRKEELSFELKELEKKNFSSQIMRSNFKHPIIKRLRKSENDFYRFQDYVELNLATQLTKKKTDTDYYGYYPDVTKLIKAFNPSKDTGKKSYFRTWSRKYY